MYVIIHLIIGFQWANKSGPFVVNTSDLFTLTPTSSTTIPCYAAADTLFLSGIINSVRKEAIKDVNYSILMVLQAQPKEANTPASKNEISFEYRGNFSRNLQ